MRESNNGSRSQDTAKVQEKESELLSQVETALGGSSMLLEDVTSMLTSAQSSKSRAEESVAAAEMEALRAIEARRDRVREQTEALIAKAETAKEVAVQARADANKSHRDAEKAKAGADEYLRKKQEEAEQKASDILRKATDIAEKEANAIKSKALAQAERVKEHLVALRTAHQEELEAQRLLTKAAEIRARYSSVLGDESLKTTLPSSNADLSSDETPGGPVEPVVSPARRQSKQAKG